MDKFELFVGSKDRLALLHRPCGTYVVLVIPWTVQSVLDLVDQHTCGKAW